MLGLSPSTVHYLITRRGESATTKSGRPRITDVNMDQNLYEATRKDAFLSAVDLQKELTLSCSVETVRNRLKQKGLKCTPDLKPFLTQFHRQSRFMYAHSKLHWSVPEWHRVVFSDEKIFRSSSRGALRVYRPCSPSSRLINLLLNVNPGINSRFFNQKIAEKEPEKKIPSTAAKATNRFAKDGFCIQFNAHSAFFLKQERVSMALNNLFFS
ncbi:UNVERIFIED_CONTAM: uncharacterized protein NCL1_54612 [Trichonephila clavipes]